MRRTPARPMIGAAVSAALVIGLTASCSLAVGSDDELAAADQVVLVTHESFVLPEKLQAEFEKESGYDLVIRSSGDVGTLTNKLVLTKDDPTGDVAFGVDNTFASRAVDEGVFQASDVPGPAGSQQFDLAGDAADLLHPVDNGNVCVNVDDTWFAEQGIPAPTTLEDLTKPAYRDLFVLPGATTSSPGLAFLLTTVAAFGDQWPAYWTKLMANGALLTDGWSDAYQVDFTQGGGGGDRPIVLSYDSSPAFTVADGASTTSALLDTCFTQIEYAGVLAGAANAKGGAELISFLQSPEVQAALPDAMYVFPVDPAVALPADWAAYAVQPTKPWSLEPDEIADQRESWLTQWSDVTSR